MAKRRVVVTGLGMLSPVGNTVDSSWKNILAGKSGIAPITSFDCSSFTTQFAGEVKNFNAEQYIPKKETKKMDRFIQLGIAAGKQALVNSGLEVTAQNAARIGVAIGSGIGGLGLIEDNHRRMLESGPRKISPFFVPATITNMISGFFSIFEGLKGPNINVVTACTTGVHNIGIAARIIAYGDADAMIAGGAESTVCALGIGGFAAARALSTCNHNPEAASRPWDKDRDGFVMGEGAGVLMLENYVKDGYSQERMLQILKNRCQYLIERGSTLNNPHIPASYFRGWERITDNHEPRLRELVNQSLNI